MSAELIQIIIFAMVAAFIALRLISTFGRNPGDEHPPRVDPMQRRENGSSPNFDIGSKPDRSPDPVRYLHVAPHVGEALTQMSRQDPQFDAALFLDGARKAYEMILEAFWKGDKETYTPFVDEDIAQNFSTAIAARDAEGLTLSNRLVALNKAEITHAVISGTTGSITIVFDADIIAATHDQDGNLVEGSMSDTHNVKDKWVFSRNLGSGDPNWTLVETATVE